MTTTTPSYNNLQTTFSLCTISNIGSLFNEVGDIKENTIAGVKAILADTNIQSFVGSWDLAWGPSVNLDPLTGVAANAMYIVYNSTLDTYLVCIAGTDPVSLFEWILEDFFVSGVVEWPYSTTNPTAHISYGASIGLAEILSLTDATSNKTALEYLKSVKAKTINVTGHSLGGTLAPLFSTYLANSMSGINITCSTFAGLTPGDANFVAYYNSIPNITNNKIWNSNDVAPHLYQLNMLQEIKSIYNPVAIPWNDEFDTMYNELIKYSKQFGYTQFPASTAYPQYSPFTFPLYPSDIILPDTDAPQAIDYTKEASLQHVTAYAYTMGVVDGFLTSVTDILNNLGHGVLVKGPYFTEDAPPPAGS